MRTADIPRETGCVRVYVQSWRKDVTSWRMMSL